jgi:hypothetical protein
MLNNFRVWLLYIVSFLVGLRTYHHPLVYENLFLSNFSVLMFARIFLFKLHVAVFFAVLSLNIITAVDKHNLIQYNGRNFFP